MCNVNLLKAIREKGWTQKKFSEVIGDHETLVSRVIRGHWNLDEARKIKWAKALKTRPEVLFR